MKPNPIPYSPCPAFILRSPLFPVNFLQETIQNSPDGLERLWQVCRRPDVQEAIFLASPNLFEKLQRHLQGELNDRKEIERLPAALMRYLIRMCSRPTPFGLFAGFSIGQWADTTQVTLPPLSKYERHTRLDMNYLCALAMDLAKHPIIKEKIQFFPNSSIYQLGNQIRYVEYRYRDANRTHHIVGVEFSDYLDRVLKKASTGSLINDLAKELVDKEISQEESRGFIEELIESQLLVSELEPAITGPEFLEQILRILDSIEGIDETRQFLGTTHSHIQSIDKSPIGSTQKEYLAIADRLKTLGTTYELKFLFQTDMVKPTLACTLSSQIHEDILKALEIMNKLTPRPSQTNLTQFRDNFIERYEEREIPLIQALDTESGLGYLSDSNMAGDVSPLVDDLMLSARGGPGNMDIRWSSFNSLMLKKYLQSVRENSQEIQLTDKDLENLTAQWDDLPDSISVMATIFKNKSNPQARDTIMMEGAGGSSAANLLGRFCHADQKTYEFVKTITKREAELHPQAILAEIIHLSQSRLGNILLRPIIRDYEIPYLAKASVPVENQIKLDDLLVSVQNQRVVLRSRQLNREIIPHLSTAHNYSMNALPIYHFLCDLQTQNLRGGVGFNWGPLASEYAYLPRVVYANLILSPQTWNIRQEEVKPFISNKDQVQMMDQVAKWREKMRLPREVLLVEGDNKLLIDFSSLLSVQTLWTVIKNHPGFQLSEFILTRDNAVIQSEEGYFSNEFIISFYKNIVAEGQN